MPDTRVTLVYVIEQDEAVRDSLKALIESNGFSVRDFVTKEQFLLGAEPGAGKCLVLGFSRCDAEAVKALRSLRMHRPDLPVILVVGQVGRSPAVIPSGDAFAQLDRPVQETTLIQAIRRAAAH